MFVYPILFASVAIAFLFHSAKLQASPEVTIACRTDHLSICDEVDERLFQSIPDNYPVLQHILAHSDKYLVQIQYTQINRDKYQKPHFITYQYAVNDQQYHYPASTVKLPVAALTLQWLEQQQANINVDTTLHTYSSRPTQQEVIKDNNVLDSQPSLHHYIKQVLMVSDNPGFNRMYELLGQDYINQQLRQKGLVSATINHRLSLPMSAEENRHYNPMAFINKDGDPLLQLPARVSDTLYQNELVPLLGQRYFAAGKLIDNAMDFTDKNRLSIADFSGVLERLIFPELFPAEQQFQISERHRALLLQYMTMLPSESKQPDYASKDIADNRYKYIKFGGAPRAIPRHQRWLNKIGSAYGFLTDGGYFIDLEHGIEFFVTATIYVNENQILNDDTYEYQQLGLPFYQQLGDYLYQHELNRTKEVMPDLGSWQRLIDHFVQ